MFTDAPPAPEIGQAVYVRNRLATVKSVEPYDSREVQGRLHIVEVEYLDDYRQPEADQLLWEVETTASILGKTPLPTIDDPSRQPDKPEALRSFVHAHQWTRINRLHATANLEDEPLLGVWNSAIQVHPYQLEPVLRALEMPRVSLLLCDGVGLGKTIQGGLVLEELLLRRRIRRILVLCPAMLQRQWRDELRRKFNIDFEIIDSESTFQLRRRLGIDTNPWKAFTRIITSMDYLRLPDVLQQFLQASGAGTDQSYTERSSPHAAWDLLIVDECHNFAPQSGNRSSQRTRMLRDIRFLFEHRIFLSATPHNGKTVCFTGLLELLDPVRFQMTVEMDESDRRNLNEIRIRRLKDDINQHSLRPPFAEQLPPIELPIRLSAREADLYAALRNYREKGQQFFNEFADAAERWVGQFIFTILTKRLLSCPFAFARTWWRHLQGEEDIESDSLFALARVSSEKAEEAIKSDEEKSQAEEDAVRHGGAWLRSKIGLEGEWIERVNAALSALGYDQKTVEDDNQIKFLAKQSDSKTDALVKWVKENLFDPNGRLRDDERLIIFTEYKETLNYLEERFRMEGFDENTLKLLYGGMGAEKFKKVQQEFEDPNADVRLLLATDAASEGINMQECCRWVIHYDIPWSPTKIQQRNGRVSRHGQVRDVSVHYFRCDQDEDMDFLLKVAKKVEQVREDLGSVERVFDYALHSHFRGMRTSENELDRMIEREKQNSMERAELGSATGDEIEKLTQRAHELLEQTEYRMGISPQALKEILQTAIQVEGKGALIEIPDKPGFYRLHPPPDWETLVRQTLTVGRYADRMELVFDSALVEEEKSGRRVMRLKKYQVLMRLGHPVMRQAMATLCRQLHDKTSKNPIFGWTIAALHRSNFDSLLIFHYTLSAVNELREPLHDEVCSAVFRIEGDRLVRVEKNFAETILREPTYSIHSEKRLNEWVKTIRMKWPPHKSRLEEFMAEQERSMKDDFEQRAKAALKRSWEEEKQNYQFRLKELSERTQEKALRKLAEVRLQVEAQVAQGYLLPEIQEDAEMRMQQIEQEMAVLRRDVDETRSLLERERDQRLKEMLPKRFALREVRVLPLAVEYLIPALAEDLKP